MQEFYIKTAEKEDLSALLTLYTGLHGNPYPVIDAALEKLWERLLQDPNHYILLGRVGEKTVSSCVLVIIENLTHGQRPYALIENVITHSSYRNRGYASRILAAAKGIAVQENCYKMMLMTGSKEESTLRFYEQAGFNSKDKTGFVLWL